MKQFLEVLCQNILNTSHDEFDATMIVDQVDTPEQVYWYRVSACLDSGMLSPLTVVVQEELLVRYGIKVHYIEDNVTNASLSHRKDLQDLIPETIRAI